jgi:hypothetical protein
VLPGSSHRRRPKPSGRRSRAVYAKPPARTRRVHDPVASPVTLSVGSELTCAANKSRRGSAISLTTAGICRAALVCRASSRNQDGLPPALLHLDRNVLRFLPCSPWAFA